MQIWPIIARLILYGLKNRLQIKTHLRGSISNGGTGDARHAVDAGVSRPRRLRLSLNRARRREYMFECLEIEAGELYIYKD